MCKTLVVTSDQEASIIDVKNSFMIKLGGMEGLKVMPEESPVGASAAECSDRDEGVGDAEHYEVFRCIHRVGAQHHV